MSRRGDGQLFIGRLSKDVRTRDLEDVFELYGRLTRCDIKYGAEMAYAFVDYEDRRDAEDAVKYENGRQIRGQSIVVEWTKGAIRRPGARNETSGYDECYKCHRYGHWARDCPEERFGGSRRGPPNNRSRSPRRRSRSPRPRGRSISRSPRRRRRSPSRSRSRSRSRDNRRSRRSPSKSVSRSRSRSPARKSGSKSPRPAVSRSRTRSRGSAENGGGGD